MQRMRKRLQGSHGNMFLGEGCRAYLSMCAQGWLSSILALSFITVNSAAGSLRLLPTKLTTVGYIHIQRCLRIMASYCVSEYLRLTVSSHLSVRKEYDPAAATMSMQDFGCGVGFGPIGTGDRCAAVLQCYDRFNIVGSSEFDDACEAYGPGKLPFQAKHDMVAATRDYCTY
ncbi:uncharacterized protein PG986_005415 [Apiospora aurea]|uniref:Polyketide synthase n=1 Tax=Apiospora aurea TaxID=335848 RepID=A0ABR1QHI7_9PEZI